MHWNQWGQAPLLAASSLWANASLVKDDRMKAGVPNQAGNLVLGAY